MKRAKLLAALLIPGPSMAIAQQAPAVKSLYSYCESEPWQPTVYLSAVWSKLSTTPYQTASNGFKKLLMEKYEYEGNVTCYDFPTQATAAAELQRIRTAVSRSKKVISTTWVFAGAPPAPPPPPPPPTTGVQAAAAADPRLAGLAADDRAWIVAEYPAARGYCENNMVLSEMVDCDQFARAVLNFRINHVNEKGPDGSREPLVNIVSDERLDCSACLVDAKTRKWADQESRHYLSVYIAQQKITEKQVQDFAECFGTEFTTRFRSKPAITRYRDAYADAAGACRKRMALP
ncbi:MAG TPA: hypothetical protein VGP61_09520 [Gemmatimonadales bacterium]|nr:hypothetical protein [Gemmatimonadales bacterium]